MAYSLTFHIGRFDLKVNLMNDVKAIFDPKRIVLIGSSTIREKVGMASPQLFKSVAHNMHKFFHGKIRTLDVNGKAKQNNLSKMRWVPELAVIMLPPKQSVAQAEKCAEAGVQALVMITGGYKNCEREQLFKLKEKYGVRILGPNTIMGVINTSNGLNTTFERDVMPKKGNIAVISQSGGVGAYILDWACFYGVGISKFAFMGDKIDVDDVELLQYFRRDKNTKVICLYMEGVIDGRKFIEEARKTVKEKPIVALKGGITQESAQRAKSHTASIAGSDAIFDAAFKKAGIIRAENIEELMDTAIALSKQSPMRGDNVAIVSNVGGPAILAADVVVKNNLKLATLSEKTKTKIEKLYPGVDATNPIDMIADARSERYAQVLELVLEDKNVDGVLVINMLKSCFFEPNDAKVIPKIAVKFPDKPVVDVPAGGQDFELVYNVLGNTRIPLYNMPEKAAKALKALRAYGKIVQK
ncbi:CoA-binding protein [Candidatus Bathyarchaeota archaeon]|nr:CoA-binding protein [Candidatus Bathyarchaeota archaeon]